MLTFFLSLIALLPLGGGEITPKEAGEIDRSLRQLEHLVDLVDEVEPRHLPLLKRAVDKQLADVRRVITDAYIDPEPAPEPDPVIEVNPPDEPRPDPMSPEYVSLVMEPAERDTPFADGEPFAWMDDAIVASYLEKPNAMVWTDPRKPMVWTDGVGYNSDRVAPFPDYASNRTIVHRSDRSSYHSEVLPKWGIRAYNVVGTLRDLTLIRVGDFRSGREGHAVYINTGGEDILIDGLTAIQCGGQALQVVGPWGRPSETRLPQEQWPGPGDTFTVRDLVAIDCGAINEGAAVRASYPFTYYAPGHDLVVEGMTVRTKLPSFSTSSGPRNSHGGIFVGPVRPTAPRTDSVILRGLDFEIYNPDRSAVKLKDIDSALLDGVRFIDTDGEGVPSVTIVDDCGRVEIRNVLAPFDVKIADTERERAYQTQRVEAGEDYVYCGAR